LGAVGGLFGPALFSTSPVWPLEMSLNWALAAGVIGRWVDVFSTIVVLEVEGVRENAPGLGSNRIQESS